MNLCQSQVSLLVENFGAGWCGVYLREEEETGLRTKLFPIVIYPSDSNVTNSSVIASGSQGKRSKGNEVWEVKENQENEEGEAEAEELKERESKEGEYQADISPVSSGVEALEESKLIRMSQVWELEKKIGFESGEGYRTFWEKDQVVVPLLYQNMVMGLLVTRPGTRKWDQRDIRGINEIAKTIGIACFLDRQRLMYKDQLNQSEEKRKWQASRVDNWLHQFRNPLTALQTFSKLLIKHLISDDRHKKIVTGLLRESEHLKELLEEFNQEMKELGEETVPLLSSQPHIFLPTKTQVSLPSESSQSLFPLSVNNSGNVNSGTVNAGRKSKDLKPFRLSEVTESLLLSAEVVARDKGLEFEVKINPLADKVLVLGSPSALREVLSNLVDNAIKYTDVGGKVEVELGLIHPEYSWCGIKVYNSGVGIPPEDQEHIFERHYRGIQSKGSTKGSGLGLAIAKELMEQMRGSIEWVNPNYNPSNPNTLDEKDDKPEEKPGTTFPGTMFRVWLSIAS